MRRHQLKRYNKSNLHLLRQYDAAKRDRLTHSWGTGLTAPNQDVLTAITPVRSRARELYQNNDYVRRFVQLCRVNVVGHKGITFQCRAKNPDGSMDKTANEKIETAWSRFMRPGNFDMSGHLSGREGQTQVIASMMVNGEFLVECVTGPEAGNREQFRLHFIDVDLLDAECNLTLANGNRVIMGIEVDRFSRPVNYYILKDHPAATTHQGGAKHTIIPAERIIHGFFQERPGQVRSVSPMASAMTRLKMLGGYEEAELVASRTSSSKMGFFTSELGTGLSDGDGYDYDDEKRALITEAEPGSFEQLPEGVDFKEWNPQHPTSAFEGFVKAILRGIASGLGVSYVSLANDLEGVSYSSIRQGELSDRAIWRELQAWLIEHFLTPVFEKWLDMALITGAIQLPYLKFDNFNAPHWKPRGWAWVDPAKEIKAAREAVQAGFKSISNIHAEEGLDTEEVFATLAANKQAAEAHGLDLSCFTPEHQEQPQNETQS